MSAQAQRDTIEGLAVKSTPLPVMDALDLYPELLEFVSAFVVTGDDGEFLGEITKLLANKRLRALLPRILAGTSVMVPEGEGGREISVTLSDTNAINLAFDGRMKALPGVIAFAIKTSFADFFAGSAQIVSQLRAQSS